MPQFSNWVTFHYPAEEMKAMRLIEKETTGIDIDCVDFWKTVCVCAIHGKLDLVCDLLHKHSRSNQKAFIIAQKAIREMPVFAVYSGHSVNEVLMRWKLWQTDLISLIENQTFAIDLNLHMLMKVTDQERNC